MQDDPEAVRDVFLLLDRGPLHLRLRVTIAGKSPEAVRRDYLVRLFRALDTDDDGKLTRVEFERSPLNTSRRGPNSRPLSPREAAQTVSADKLAEALEVASLTIAARRLVRRRPLRVLLDEVAQKQRPDRQVDGTDPVIVAQRFHRYRRLVPLSTLCLPDTIAFLRFAARRRCFPHIVFGVEAWPFAAHCWAQTDDCVLNDALDHARSFAQILVQ